MIPSPSRSVVVQPPTLAQWRERALAQLTPDASPAPADAADALKSLHELQVHQVEVLLQQAEIERAHAELRLALQRQLQLYDEAPVGYVTVDVDGNILEANRTAGVLLLGAGQSLVGERLDRHFTSEGARELLAMLRHVAQWPSQHMTDAQVEQPDGAPGRLLQLEARVLPDSHDVLLVLIDVTAQRQAEQLRLRADVAEQANLAKTMFLSQMSHELRTPLNAVIGFTHLLGRNAAQLGLDPRQLGWIGQVQKAGQHMLNLINDALDLARIDAGHQDLTVSMVGLASSVADAVALVSLQAQERGVTLEINVGPACHVVAEPHKLAQVLINLLSNAIKYNRPGGRVVVSCTHEPATVTIRVSDDGPGMTSEQLQRLFRPFERLGAEHSGVEGTGLGLLVSQRLAQAMNGSLTLESQPGQGTTASLQLLCAD